MLVRLLLGRPRLVLVLSVGLLLLLTRPRVLLVLGVRLLPARPRLWLALSAWLLAWPRLLLDVSVRLLVLVGVGLVVGGELVCRPWLLVRGPRLLGGVVRGGVLARLLLLTRPRLLLALGFVRLLLLSGPRLLLVLSCGLLLGRPGLLVLVRVGLLVRGELVC